MLKVRLYPVKSNAQILEGSGHTRQVYLERLYGYFQVGCVPYPQQWLVDTGATMAVFPRASAY
jgi:hypothetical protein